MRISVIAAFGAAIFWGGAVLGQEALERPSQFDKLQVLSTRLSYIMARSTAGKVELGMMLADVLGDPSYSNPLRATLLWRGENIPFQRRQAVNADEFIHIGASFQSAAIAGDLSYVSPKPGQSAFLRNVDKDMQQIMDATKFPSDWPKSEVRRGSVEHGGIIFDYALYRTPSLGGRDCVYFTNKDAQSFSLLGHVCAPLVVGLGKSRAEAIIRGIGIDPVIPVEATPDIATIPAE